MNQPLPLTVKTILPHPTKALNTRGARSRAGLKPAMVSGASKDISRVMVSPMVTAVSGPGREEF